MPDNNIITFAVEGTITLHRFALAVRRFSELVTALSSEVGKDAGIEWILDDLEYGSAVATARGVVSDDVNWPSVEEVVNAYYKVGTALEANQPIPYSTRVADRARRVRDLLNHSNTDIEAIRFETLTDDVTIERESAPQPLPVEAREQAYGAVEGRIQAISNRGGLHFTLYDTLQDRAVSCYLEPGRESLMKDVWGRLAVVEGWVKRNRNTGQPRTVRLIRMITVLPEPMRGGYIDARGAWPRDPTTLRAEDAIRRIRDAG